MQENQKHIVFVGLMGCGKSRMARELSAKFDIPYFDCDHEIELKENKKITQIFNHEGEKYFRELEYKTMNDLLNGEASIISTGGGSFINENIRSLIKEKAISIWLKVDLETIKKRVSKNINKRPLLIGKDLDIILGNYIVSRYPTYAKADITIHNNSDDIESKLDMIMQEIRKFINS